VIGPVSTAFRTLAAFPTRDHIRTQQAIENYLGGSSKALQFVIDALKRARDESVSWMRFLAWWSGTNSDHFLLHYASIVRYGDWTAELPQIWRQQPGGIPQHFAPEIAVGARAIIVRRRHHHEKLSVGSEDQDAGRKPAR
jgi:hypothetical protein